MPIRHRSKRGSRCDRASPSLRTAVHGFRRIQLTGQRRGELPDATRGTARFRLTHLCGARFYFQEAEEAAPTVAELANHAK
jgi:hypothetical protein